MRNANPQQQPAASELMLRPQNSILKKPSADGATRTGGPAAPPNPAHRATQENGFPGSPNQSNFPGQTTGQSSMATGRPQTNCRAMGDMEPAQRQGSLHQQGQKQPHGVLEQNGQMQRQGSFQQQGQMGGSAYNMNGGSVYGPGNGSMGPGGMGGGMGGSMYGPGNGSTGPGGMGGGMGGSMYGPGNDGMSRGQSVTAHWNNLNNMSLMNIRDEGSMYGANSRCNINFLCPNIASADDHVQLKRSGKRGGRTTEAVSKGENGKPMATGTTVAPLIVRKTSFSRKEEPKTTAKVPANYNIHSLILLDKEGDASKTMKVSVKDPNTLLLKRDGGKDETFENDECILRDKMTSSVNSVLLMDLQENWIAGHTTGLLVGGGKDRGDACVELVKQFLTQCLEKAEKNRKDNSIDFDVTVTLGAVESSDRIRDLLNPDSRSYEKMQLGSSPVSGPCLCGMTTKTVNSSKECVKVVDEGVGRSDNKKQLIVAFFLLKQIKKSSGEKDVYLSSLCMGIAREAVSHLNGLREKSKSEPCTLFRYAIGGASVTVNALVLSGRDSEMRGCLELGRKMREIKNTPPRSGNVKRCVEGAKKEISRQKDKMDKMGDTEKKSTERIVTSMENMVKDCEEMLSKPETTKPKGYPMGGGR